MKTIYLAGGCFWCIASCFNRLQSVQEVVSGFSGGTEINPTYEDVKSQKTSHRETIRIVYDESKITYEQLLNIFVRNVDLYDEEGQFIDRGHSYTLAIYYTSNEEKEIAEKILNVEKEKSGKSPCVSIEEFISFYPAEEYHQNYNLTHPEEFEKELIESGRKRGR